jgi:hypothetical protein
MRYLSQLARETVARVVPSRQPSWLHDMGLLVESSEVEPGVTPAVHAQPSMVVGDARAERPMMNRRDEDSRDADLLPARTGRREQTEAAEVDAPVARAHKQVTEPTRGDAWPMGLMEAADRRPVEPVAEVSPRNTNEMRTIGDVLAEIARRQHELEVEPLATRTSAGLMAPVSFAPERPGKRAAAGEVSVHIGSITVQVDPAPAVTAPALAAPVRRALAPARTTSNEWSRSFLDR